MGYWGVKSYENDDADDALDAGFERVHGELYEQLMDDRNPLSFEQVQKRLADGRTLAASVEALEELIEAKLTDDPEAWDDAARLAFAGIVVRHAELGVAIPGRASVASDPVAPNRGDLVGRSDPAESPPRERTCIPSTARCTKNQSGQGKLIFPRTPGSTAWRNGEVCTSTI